MDFLFGSIAVLMVVCLYGSGWGTITALIAGLHTVILWKHPYAAVILTLEGLFIGRGLRLKRQNLLLLDGFYWVFIGMPLVWLFYFHILSVPAQTVLLIALKQAVNGIFNALVASLLLAHLPLGKWVTRLRTAKSLSLYPTLFNLLVACVFFPALMLIVLHSRSALLNIETAIPANLQHASSDLVVELRSWHQQNLNTLKQLADVAARSGMAPSFALQQSTELIQRTHSSFEQVWVVDEAGKAIASYPKTNTPIANNTDLKAFSQTKQTVISDVLVTSDEGVLTRIIQAIPIVHNQRWLGSVVGELNLSFVDKFLNSLVYPQHLEITLVDRQNRVISSTRSDLANLETFDHSQGGEIRLLKAGVYQWLPVEENMPMMSRWKNSFYVQKTPVGNNLPLTVIVEAPNQPHFNYLQNLYIGSLASVLLIVVLALILANLISYWLTRPI
ncbi:MAG: PDC sensor domain-containing protein, partial [Coleofasciculus sp. S288]|nr:PDC sensor domain-containing protein [Coleofasciculus sp. S288]